MSETKTLFPVVPKLQWNDRDYSKLRGRLYLFDDNLVMEKFDDTGRPGEMYMVDPLDIAARMSGAIGLSSGLLPPGCLSWAMVNGEARVAICVEAQVWPVSVEGEKLTWQVPMPRLVVVGQGQTYHFFALREAVWPTLETPLYAAPCPNLGNRGVCTGNVPFPVASAETMRQAVQAFFGSGFNTHLDDNKSVAYPKSVLDQWRKLNKRKATEYPVDDLVEVRVNVRPDSWQKRQMMVGDLAALKMED